MGIVMNDRIEKRLNDMPDIYRNNYKKAMKGRNRTAAVKAFCLECVGWQRNEVKEEHSALLDYITICDRVQLVNMLTN